MDLEKTTKIGPILPSFPRVAGPRKSLRKRSIRAAGPRFGRFFGDPATLGKDGKNRPVFDVFFVFPRSPPADPVLDPGFGLAGPPFVRAEHKGRTVHREIDFGQSEYGKSGKIDSKRSILDLAYFQKSAKNARFLIKR